MKIYADVVPLVYEKYLQRSKREKSCNEDEKKSKDDTSYHRVSLYNSKLNSIIINSNILGAN